MFGTKNIVGSGGKTDTIVREKYSLRGTAPEDALLSHCWGPLHSKWLLHLYNSL